ncbi:MAG: transposase family protein [Chloroflexi bacterium]|nr:transposase family protein [Chloroflexota bacterium]
MSNCPAVASTTLFRSASSSCDTFCVFIDTHSIAKGGASVKETYSLTENATERPTVPSFTNATEGTMRAGEEMTLDERRKYLGQMLKRYRAADRAGREGSRRAGRLLTEMEVVTGLHRKHLVRLLAPGGLLRRPRGKQRARAYGAAVDDVLRIVWESLEYVCAERLTPALLPTAEHLAGFGEVRLTPALREQLGRISRATVQRRLDTLCQDTPRLPRRGPEAANQVARTLPMGRLAWETAEPGHCEVDLVHHSGPIASGDDVHTLQLVDIATGWSERVAILGRGQRAMEAGFGAILARLPFPIKHLHPDNGSEFLNHHLVRYWGQAIVDVQLSRSRPFHKNEPSLH